MNSLIWIAVLLIIAWIVVRLALAVTSVFLHLLWVAAVILFVIWLIRRLS